MKFPELVIHNFLAITDATIDLADRGLVAIMGENHADTSALSNGTGKSSVADALCWCWFGVTARGETGDDIINNLTGKDCYVRSTVIDGPITYVATRHRKHKVFKNSLQIVMTDGTTETDLTKGTDKLTQEVANQIIGCSLDVFAGSIYAGQEKMPDLPAMTDKGLKMLIEEAAGTTVLEAAYKKAREDAAAVHAKMLAISAERDRASHTIDLMKGHLDGVETQIIGWDENRDVRREDIKTQISVMIPALKRLQEDIAVFDIPALDASIKECDDKVAAVTSEQAELRKYDLAVAEARGMVNTAIHKFTLVSKEHSIIEAEISRISHKIGCPCSECGRPMTEAELGAARASAESRLEFKAEELIGVKTEHDSAVDAQARAESVRDVFAASMTDISAVAAQRAEYVSMRSAVNALVARQASVTTQAKALRDRMVALTAEVNPYHAQKEKLEADITAAEDKLIEIEQRYLEAETDYAVEAEVVKVFSPAGVRAHILDEVTPFLNEQTAKYLTTLSDGNMEATWSTLTPDSKGVLKEKFTIDVTHAKGGGKFGLISGGEKRKARIATALALQDLVSTRASKPIELFIGDEIDDALDAAGLERLMIVLEDKARERGSVFIISHNELRDHIRQVINIEKMEDMTTRISETSS
ncbi:AAA family ATPase [Agrobacterium sp. CG674]